METLKLVKLAFDDPEAVRNVARTYGADLLELSTKDHYWLVCRNPPPAGVRPWQGKTFDVLSVETRSYEEAERLLRMYADKIVLRNTRSPFRGCDFFERLETEIGGP